MTEFTNAPPCLSDEALLAITEQHFGITGKIQPLASERDQNARLLTSHGDYVLKVANLAEDPALLSLQNRVSQTSMFQAMSLSTHPCRSLFVAAVKAGS